MLFVSQYYQIFYGIVRGVFVQMMNMFSREKPAPNFPFHDETMFRYASSSVWFPFRTSGNYCSRLRNTPRVSFDSESAKCSQSSAITTIKHCCYFSYRVFFAKFLKTVSIPKNGNSLMVGTSMPIYSVPDKSFPDSVSTTSNCFHYFADCHLAVNLPEPPHVFKFFQSNGRFYFYVKSSQSFLNCGWIAAQPFRYLSRRLCKVLFPDPRFIVEIGSFFHVSLCNMKPQLGQYASMGML